MSGPVLRWSSDDVEVEVVPRQGARLHRVRAFGVDVLRTPPDLATYDSDPFYWGGFPMAPWCNRLSTAPTTVAGRVVELPAGFRDGSAIHGQVMWLPWDVDGNRLSVRAGGDGWPWNYEVHLDVRVEGATAHLSYAVRNVDDGPMPAGIGVHPWFVKPLAIAVPATAVYPRNEDEVLDAEPVRPPFDLRRQAPPADDLDATWTDLTDHAVHLAWPGHGVRAALRFSPAAPVVVVAAPADVDAVAVEPETHAPGGLRRLAAGAPDAMALLAPGESLTLDYALAFERVTAGGP